MSPFLKRLLDAGPHAVPGGPAAAWRRALAVGPRPLLHPGHRVVVLFSPKSACSSFTIWLLHQLGLAGEARAFSNWPHDYRIQRLYARADDVAARAALQPDEVKLLRVVRCPLQRAVSSFRHALGTLYAQDAVREKLGIDMAAQGLSFERFIDFLALEDLDFCDPHHRRQRHPLERVRQPDVVINASRQDLFAGLNAFEALAGMPPTDFTRLAWVHELQATREPQPAAPPADPYRVVLTEDQARHGPWPQGLLTPEARERLAGLYAEDVALYGIAG